MQTCTRNLLIWVVVALGLSLKAIVESLEEVEEGVVLVTERLKVREGLVDK